MSQYRGKTAVINRPQAEVFARLSDLRNLQSQLDTLPEEARKKMGEVSFSEDAIIITAAPVGEIVLRITRREAPTLLEFNTENSPVPMGIELTLAAIDDDKTELKPVINVEIPAMLRPFVGPKLQEAADKMGDTMGSILNQQ
ncbi:MAG: hypothetical protein HUK14_11360 [Muribaculaceae bacterium]|nr:hypothetical protein [Muribaculaceae bacterium]